MNTLLDGLDNCPLPEIQESAGSALLYDVFFGNNDYDTTGSTPAEALSEISCELETAMSAVLLLRHGMTKADALKAVDNLRWLVESSDLPNEAEPVTFEGEKLVPASFARELERENARLYKIEKAAQNIRHWHDSANGGMIVSGEHVRILWSALAANDKITNLRA